MCQIESNSGFWLEVKGLAAQGALGPSSDRIFWYSPPETESGTGESGDRSTAAKHTEAWSTWWLSADKAPCPVASALEGVWLPKARWFPLEEVPLPLPWSLVECSQLKWIVNHILNLQVNSEWNEIGMEITIFHSHTECVCGCVFYLFYFTCILVGNSEGTQRLRLGRGDRTDIFLVFILFNFPAPKTEWNSIHTFSED